MAVEAARQIKKDSLAKLLLTKLGGTAFSYWDCLPAETKSNVSVVKDKLKPIFGQTAFLSTFQIYVNAHTCLPGEPLPVFAAKISHLVEEAFPANEKNAKDGEKFWHFIVGIEPYLQVQCHEQGLKTPETDLQFAIQTETAHQASTIVSAANFQPIFL